MPRMTAEDYTDFEAGPYMAKLLEVEEHMEGGWENGPFYLWKFEISEDGEYQGRTLTRRTSTAFSPRANARQYAEAVLGRKIQGGEGVDTDDLVGLPCNIQVSINETDRGTFANIDGVYPLRKNQKAGDKGATPQSDAASEADEDFESIPF